VGQEWDSQLSPIAQPKLNFMAPEFVLTATCDTAIDMFSVGVLIHALYNNGQPVFDSMNDWSKFKSNVSKVSVHLLIIPIDSCLV
jgi:SCY1-like protein 2